MTIPLVSYDDAEWQLNDDVIDPGRIERLIELASGIVLTSVDPEYPAAWLVEDSSPSEYEVPLRVQQVVLMLIAEMNQNREMPGVLSETMVRMLQPWRLPTLSSLPAEEDEDEE